MHELSIVILTYNSTKQIFDCLKSIFSFNDVGDKLEVIVVDNHSDECPEMFETISLLYGNKVTLIDSGNNRGYGSGNNIGIRLSRSNIVVVMNPDVRITKPIFKKIIDCFNEEKTGMVGVNFEDGSTPYYFKRGHSTLIRNLFSKYYIWKKKFVSEDMFLSGSFLAFNKKAFWEAGGFDENIFLYSEEADIANRISAKGYQVVWKPDIYVFHMAHGREYNPKLDLIRLESGRYYESKYNIDSEKEYRLTVQTIKIKMIISALLLNKTKTQYFKRRLKTLEDFYRD